MFDNSQGISDIQMTGNVIAFCPMGDDWYNAEVNIHVNEPKTIPDYCDITDYLQTLNGQDLILEDVCQHVFDFVTEQTGGNVIVDVFTDTANHIPVKVTISG